MSRFGGDIVYDSVRAKWNYQGTGFDTYAEAQRYKAKEPHGKKESTTQSGEKAETTGDAM